MATKIKVLAKAQNRLALGILRAYTVIHPEATLDDVRAAFPRKICPDSGVSENFIDLKAITNAQGANWNGFFSKPGEPIPLADGTEMAMTSMWTSKSLARLIAAAEPFGIEVEKVAAVPPQTDKLPRGGEPVKYCLTYVGGWTPQTQPAQAAAPSAATTPATATARPAAATPEQPRRRFPGPPAARASRLATPATTPMRPAAATAPAAPATPQSQPEPQPKPQPAQPAPVAEKPAAATAPAAPATPQSQPEPQPKPQPAQAAPVAEKPAAPSAPAQPATPKPQPEPQPAPQPVQPAQPSAPEAPAQPVTEAHAPQQPGGNSHYKLYVEGGAPTQQEIDNYKTFSAGGADYVAIFHDEVVTVYKREGLIQDPSKRAMKAKNEAREKADNEKLGSESHVLTGNRFIRRGEDGKPKAYCELSHSEWVDKLNLLSDTTYDAVAHTWEEFEPHFYETVESVVKSYEADPYWKDQRRKKPVDPLYFKTSDGLARPKRLVVTYSNGDFGNYYDTRFRRQRAKGIMRAIARCKGVEPRLEWNPIYLAGLLTGDDLQKTSFNIGPYCCENNRKDNSVESDNREVIVWCADYLVGPYQSLACDCGFEFDLAWDDLTFMKRFVRFIQQNFNK